MQRTGRPIYGLMGFRYTSDGKVFAAVAPTRGGGMLNGEEAEEIPCTRQIMRGKPQAAEHWARAELAKRGRAFHGLYVSDMK